MHFSLDILAMGLLLAPTVFANYYIRAWQANHTGTNRDEISGMQQCIPDKSWTGHTCNLFGNNCESIDTNNNNLPTYNQIDEIKKCLPQHEQIISGWNVEVGICNYMDDNYDTCDFHRYALYK